MEQLPQEILHAIFSYTDALSILSLERVCLKFKELCGPSLWRYHCKRRFKYWDARHAFPNRLDRPIGNTDWKSLFAERFQLDRSLTKEINSVIACQHNRTTKIQRIVEKGLDAKDALLCQYHCSEGMEDYLARRWHCKAILGCLHRSIALTKWSEIRKCPDLSVSLEDTLSAFDLFVSEDEAGYYDNTCSILDRIAQDFRRESTNFVNLSLREGATALADFLRTRSLTGIGSSSDSSYYDLQNNFIGRALGDEWHSSLPLISATIYCSIAKRLGLDAKPCLFPFHVLVVVHLSTDDVAFLDPFGSPYEIEPNDLASRLKSMGVLPDDYAQFLNAAPVTEILRRCARNILNSIQTLRSAAIEHGDMPRVDSAFYAALWALMLVPSLDKATVNTSRVSADLRRLMNQVQTHFPSDIWLLQKHIVPILADVEPGTEEVFRSRRLKIDEIKTPKHRDSETLRKVSYKVGQVFVHRRYHYQATIIGWDTKCKASVQWMTQMRVYELPKGEHQSFYHVLVQDQSVRYVAEENIKIVRQIPRQELLTIAGEYFKRWDENTGSFISNVRDEYPDN